MTASSTLGRPISRVDGRDKVTGTAKYAAEHGVRDLAHGVVVSADIAKGRITRIDAAETLAVAGVLDVITHEHRPKIAAAHEKYEDDVAPPGKPFRPLYDERILFNGQPVALVVAESFEIARFAASLLRIDYEQQPHETDFWAKLEAPPKREPPPREKRGDAAMAFARAAIRLEAEYRMPVEHHNPMEPFAATAVWEDGGRLTVYDKTQGAINCRNYLANVFGMSEEKLRVLSPFVGGAFGSGLRPQYSVALAVMAALLLKRSVRVTLTRQQMFTLGYRAGNCQRLALGADGQGRLASLRHHFVGMTSQFEDFQRNSVGWSSQLYRCADVALRQSLVKLDQNTPADMRAPGGAEGMFALECAMDELAAAVGIDPLQLRLINYSERDQEQDLPFSSKELRECYRQAAERFGWARRQPEPRATREGHELIGWGVATGIWEAMQQKASARAVLTANGSLEIASGTADIGPGTYTMMAQIAAAMLGLPLENVTARLGDSTLPHAPVEGGSFTTASVGSAIHAACRKVQQEVLALARNMPGSPLAGAKLADVDFADGRIQRKDDARRAVLIADAMRAGRADRIQKEASAAPKENGKYAHTAHSAVFAEVRVDEQLGLIRVTRMVAAVAAGRILNPKLAQSQIIGALVGGIGMALHEETVMDHRFGRFMNHNLAEYHVPAHADVPPIEVMFVAEQDDEVNPLGVKGVGEIGIVGTAAAIANAVYHATGQRVRDLPITLDKLLRA